MKNRLLLFFVLFFANHLSTFGQCTFHDGNKDYSSTCFQEFKNCEGSNNYSDCIKISIAKNGNSGFLITESSSSLGGDNIHGNITLFLDDDTKIKLVNRRIKWNLNGKDYYQFYLTATEMNRLKNINIYRIYYHTCPFPEHCPQDFVKGHTYCNIETTKYMGFSGFTKDGKETDKITYPRVNWPQLILSLD